MGKNTKKKPLLPPKYYGIVEKNIYRSDVPEIENFEYIKSLELKTFLYLAQEILTKAHYTFFSANKIKFIPLGNQIELRKTHLNQFLIKEALEILLDPSNYPIMVACTSGVHETGVVIGCLRKLQNWSITSILCEYFLYAQNGCRNSEEKFIESIFDVDLVSLPKVKPQFLLDEDDLCHEEEENFEFHRLSEMSMHKSGSSSHLMDLLDISASKSNKNVSTTATVSSATSSPNNIVANTISSSSSIPAYQYYYFNKNPPLISPRSTYTKKSIIKQEE